MFSRNHKFPEIHSSKAYVLFLDQSVEASFFLFESCTKSMYCSSDFSFANVLLIHSRTTSLTLPKKLKKKHTHTDIPLLTLCTTFRLGHIRTYIAPRFRFWRTLKIAAHLKVSQRCWWRWPWSGALATFKSGKIQELHLPMVTKCLLIGGVIGLLVFSLYYYKSFFFYNIKCLEATVVVN